MLHRVAAAAAAQCFTLPHLMLVCGKRRCSGLSAHCRSECCVAICVALTWRHRLPSAEVASKTSAFRLKLVLVALPEAVLFCLARHIPLHSHVSQSMRRVGTPAVISPAIIVSLGCLTIVWMLYRAAGDSPLPLPPINFFQHSIRCCNAHISHSTNTAALASTALIFVSCNHRSLSIWRSKLFM
jgi:hypothetical protein